MSVKKASRCVSLYSPARSSAFSLLTDKHLSFFERLLSPAGVITADLDANNTDFLRVYKGNSSLLLKPRTVEQTAEVIKYCGTEKLAICPQAGNTGLVGGSVPVHDEIILHTGSFSSILGLDETLGVVKTEAGVVLDTLNSYCEAKGYIFPLDLGAKSSCMVGGNLATAAGGIRLVRYGSLHANVLGIEVVTGRGDVLNSMDSHRKDNTGYDLKQLFIGSEGTLGVITKASVLLAPKPRSQQVAFLGCSSFVNVLQLLKASRESLCEILSAFEFMDRESLELVFRTVPGTTDVLPQKYPFYVLLETSGSHAGHDLSKLECLLGTGLGSYIEDGVIARDQTQFETIWKLRESVGYSHSKGGYCFEFDFSLNHQCFYDLVEQVRAQMPLGVLTVGCGHLADGNLHLAVLCKRDPDAIAELNELLEGLVFPYLSTHHCSVSAEHGIGLMKRSHLHISRTSTEIAYMRRIKALFDPHGILNPYKLL